MVFNYCEYCQKLPNGTDSNKNTYYPLQMECETVEDYYQVFQHDFTVADFTGKCRGKDNVLKVYGITLDNDNVHSDNPNDWISATDWDTCSTLPTGNTNPIIGFNKIIYPSRSNMFPKHGKAARPKQHIVLPFETPLVVDNNLNEVVDKLDNMLNSIWSYLMFNGKSILDTTVKPWGFIYGVNTLKQEDILIYDGIFIDHWQCTTLEQEVKYNASSKSNNPMVGSLMDIIPSETKPTNIDLLKYLNSILEQVPCVDCTEGEWWEVIACVSNICNKSLEGLALVDAWSAKDTARYKANEVAYQYSQCNNDKEHKVGKTRLLEIATSHGYVDPNTEIEATTIANAVEKPNMYNLIVNKCDRILPAVDMLNEKGWAYKCKEMLGTGLCYIEERKSWYKFSSDGKCWIRDNKVGRNALNWLGDRITKHVRNMVCEPNLKKKYNNFLTTVLGSTSRLVGAEQQLIDLLSRSLKDFDIDRDVINCNGIIVNLKTSESRKILPTDLFTKCCRVAPSYDGMQEWQDCLNHNIVKEDGITPDKEVQQYLQRIMGAMLLGYGGKLYILYGCGSNGKSTILDAVSSVLEPDGNGWGIDGIQEASYSTSSSFMSKKTFNQFSTSKLVGKLMVVESDLSKSTAPSDGDIKSIYAPINQPVDAQYKGKELFSYKPYYTYFTTCNKKPKISATDPGTWRRLVVIPFFRKPIKDGDPDFLKGLLATSAPAILQWAIDGALWVSANGFGNIPVPAVIKDTTDSYRNEQGLPFKIVEAQGLIVDGTGEIDILHEYKEYMAMENGITPNQYGDIVLPARLEKSFSLLAEEFILAYKGMYEIGKRRTTDKNRNNVYRLTGVHK